jgi:hypothetical protein
MPRLVELSYAKDNLGQGGLNFIVEGVFTIDSEFSEIHPDRQDKKLAQFVDYMDKAGVTSISIKYAKKRAACGDRRVEISTGLFTNYVGKLNLRLMCRGVTPNDAGVMKVDMMLCKDENIYEMGLIAKKQKEAYDKAAEQF